MPWSVFGVVLAVALLLGAITFAQNPVASAFTSDDGAYGLAIESLVDGDGWSIPHALHEVDPDGTTYPYANSAITEDGYFPAARHAAWAAALSLPARALGTWGMRLLLFAGFAAAVAATSRLAVAAGRHKAAAVAMVLAAASPLFFNTLQFWAHTPAAAAIGLAMVGALRVMDGRRGLVPVLAVVAGCATAAAVRGDGAVFALATGVVIVASSLRARSLSGVVVGGLAGFSTVAAYVASAAFGESIVGSAAAVGAGESRATGEGRGRWLGLLHTFLSTNEGTGPFVLVVAAVALAAIGAVLIRRGDHERAAAVLVAASAIWLVRIVVFGSSTATGLIGAWPLAMLVLGRSWRRYNPAERRLICILAIGALGVAATQYDVGGGGNWGGRFLAPALPALAVLIAASLPPVRELQDVRRSDLLPAVGLLTIVCLFASWTLDLRIRSNFVDVLGVLETVDSDVPVVTSALHVPRMDWAAYPERQWLLIPAGDDGPGEIRRLLDRAGIDRVAFYLTWPATAEAIAGSAVEFEELHAGLVSVPTVVTLE